eukprot:13689593-Alexandrium_andersonii.AAC.1
MLWGRFSTLSIRLSWALSRLRIPANSACQAERRSSVAERAVPTSSFNERVSAWACSWSAAEERALA